MCGIVGVAALGKASKKQEEVRRESMIFLATELLQLTQPRGDDATGFSALFSDGNYIGLKEGIPSIEFISKLGGTRKEYNGILKVIRKADNPVKILLGHCRKVSIGSAIDNENNHPVSVGDIVGIHNGTLTNHEVIFEKLKCKRNGDVDTEAIIRLLHFYSDKGTQPFTTDMLEEVCKRLHGTYSVIAFNGNSPNQLATFRDSKPAELAIIRSLNIMLIASDKDYLNTALFRYNKQALLYMPALEGIKFPVIKSSDVEMLTMADDTAAVFDLSETIGKDTKIEDIFEKVKILRADGLWKKGTTSHLAGNTNFRNQQNQTAAAKKAREAREKREKNNAANKAAEIRKRLDDKKKDGDCDADKKDAYVWDKTKENFTRVEGIEDARKLGSIELGIEDDHDVTRMNSDDGPAKGIALENSAEDKVDTLITTAAKVEDEPFPGDTALLEEENSVKIGTTVEVDATVDAEAMELSRIAAEALLKYENNDDLLDDLGIATQAVLANMSPYALANRIRKVVFQNGYYKGFIKKRSVRKHVLNLTKKKNKAEKNIKALKTMTKILFVASNYSNLKKDFPKLANKLNDSLKADIAKATEEVLDGEKLTVKDIESVFSIGDVRENDTLKLIKEVTFNKIGG